MVCRFHREAPVLSVVPRQAILMAGPSYCYLLDILHLIRSEHGLQPSHVPPFPISREKMCYSHRTRHVHLTQRLRTTAPRDPVIMVDFDGCTIPDTLHYALPQKLSAMYDASESEGTTIRASCIHD